MTLAMRIYVAAALLVLALCFALVGAMVWDVQAQPNGAHDVLSAIDGGHGRGD